MTCTTFLHNWELDQPLPDPELQSIFDEAKKRTGKNWQVVKLEQWQQPSWWRKKPETLYGVYVYVGGMGPWQQINFFKEGSRSSINLHVPLEVVAAYFLGMLAVNKGPTP